MTIGRWQILWWWGFYFGKRAWPPPEDYKEAMTSLVGLYPDGVIFHSFLFGPIEIRRFVQKPAPAKEK